MLFPLSFFFAIILHSIVMEKQEHTSVYPQVSCG